MIMRKFIYAVFAVLAGIQFFGCSKSGKIEKPQTVLTGFARENIEAINNRACSLSEDSQILSVDTTKIDTNGFRDMLKIKRGLLKPDTRYMLNMTVEVSEAENKAYLHTLIRDTLNFKDGTDVLRSNLSQSPLKYVERIKFKTPPNNSDYTLLICAYKKLKAKVSNLSIVEDDSIAFKPMFENPKKYRLERASLPKGAKEFEVEQPNNSAGEVVEAKKFGIVPERKVTQESLNKAFAYCRDVKASKLVFEKNAVYKMDGDAMFPVTNLADFTLDGNGATFVFLKKKKPNFWVANNLRTKICNLKVDWDWSVDPLASIVRIENVDRQNDFVDFKFVDYEKFPYAPEYVRCATLTAWDASLKSVGVEDVRGFNYDMFLGRHPRPKFEWLNGNTIRFYGNSKQESAKVGNMFRMQHYYYDMNNMIMLDNRHLTLSDFTVLSCAGHAFVMSGKQKYTFFERVKIVVPENGPKRVITCTADHFHIASSCGYIKLEGCDFSRGADDCINFHDNSSYGIRKDENSIVSRHSYGAVGDRIEFRNDDYSPLRFEAKIAAKKPAGSGKTEIVFDSPIPASKNGNYIIFNREYDTRNIIVRNCHFHDNRARGILVLARDVTIENCRFTRNEMGAIKLETGYTLNIWCEGYGVDNVLIRNNFFDSANVLGVANWSYERDVFIGAYLKQDPSFAQTGYPILKNILFEKNTFKDTFGLVAAIGSAQNVVFAENTFINKTPRKNPRNYRNGFFAMSSSDIKIVNNRFVESPFTPKTGVWYDKTDTKNIVVEGNALVVEKR